MQYQELSLPFLGLVVAVAVLEYVWRKRSGRSYDLGALGGTIGTAIGQFIAKALMAGVVAGGLTLAYSAAPVQWALDDWRTWAFGFLAVEFCYYWQHRFMHEVRWFWASHATHHSPNEFTLPAALRLSWTSNLTGSWLFFVPAALCGLHPLAIALLLTLSLQYQYFLHTEAVRKLGPLEWVFNTPSHHRVHHGSNPEYIDKNYGGVLIIFDRLFGTFAEERAPVVYGLTKPLQSNNPFVIVFHEWIALFKDLSASRSITQAFVAVFGRPSATARQDYAK
jgi:sterol desaturase/sphingolipid hydroxylase (fatty acid hydroxylase superfamily)